ncbi:MAG: hypothetical protein K2F73_06700, partial [Ruminococcus sp.]|nr:hypothetical protein [Ruminococcus sp.]
MIKQFLTGVFAILAVSGTLTNNIATGTSLIAVAQDNNGNNGAPDESKTEEEYTLSVKDGEVTLSIPETNSLRTRTTSLAIRINVGKELTDAELKKNEEIASHIFEFTYNKSTGFISIYLTNVPQLLKSHNEILVGTINAKKGEETVDLSECSAAVISDEKSM